MKRDQSLTPLSRDHHHALFRAQPDDVLFPAIEQALSAEQLESLGRAVVAAESQ
jgi:hypothetical protein